MKISTIIGIDLPGRRLLKVFFYGAPHHFVKSVASIGERTRWSCLKPMENRVFADFGQWFDRDVDEFLLWLGLHLNDRSRILLADLSHQGRVERRSHWYLRDHFCRLRERDGLLLLELRRWL